MASFTRRKGQARQKQAGGRTESENVKVSKRLTYALRHGSENLNLQLRPDGFVPLEDLLRLPMFRGVCREDIEQIVGNDPKGRLSLCKEGDVELIRANQGHSVQGLVDPEKLLTRVVDASEVPVCVHGTFKQYWDSILSGGLSRMGRTHIHFATGLPEESGVISGMRSSCQLLIYVDIGAAMRDGIVFYRSSNNVILTAGMRGSLSTDYFSRVVDVTVQGGRIIFPHHKTENAEELQAKPSSSQQHPGAPLGRVNGCARGSGAVSLSETSVVQVNRPFTSSGGKDEGARVGGGEAGVDVIRGACRAVGVGRGEGQGEYNDALRGDLKAGGGGGDA